MLIDAHNHPDWHGHNLDKCIKNMDKYNIDKTWLLSWECPSDEFDPAYSNVLFPTSSGPIPFEYALRYTEKYPDRFILGYAPDPRRPDAIDRLDAAVNIYNVKIYGELKVRMMYDNPDALRMFRFCGKKGLPVVAHIDYEFEKETKYPRLNYWYGGGIEVFERAVKACPDTVFLGHAPGFWAHISGDDQYNKTMYPKGDILPEGKLISMLRRYDNLYCDISGASGCGALNRDLEFSRKFLSEFQDRVLYARDQFDNIHRELLDSFGLADDVMKKIMSGNALRLLDCPDINKQEEK